MYVYNDMGYYQNEKEVPVYYNNVGFPIYLGRVYGETSGLVGGQKIEDVDGDGEIGNGDLYYIGSALPKAYGGWANEITWKNFDLNILFNYSLGRKMINVASYTLTDPSSGISLKRLSGRRKAI